MVETEFVYFFPVGFLFFVLLFVAVFFYRYRLDEIPGISFSQAFTVFLFCRVADSGSFLWSQKMQGWDAVGLVETNPLHWFLGNFLTPDFTFWAVSASGILFVILFLLFARSILIRNGNSTNAVDRFTYMALATYSSMSLFGAATNISFGILGFNSPFLI